MTKFFRVPAVVRFRYVAVGCALLLLGVAQSLRGQGATNAVSPYSSYGIGDLFQAGLSRNYSMGGLTLGTFDRFNVNLTNPAGLADLLFTSVEVTFNYRLNRLSTNDSKTYFRSGGLSGIALGFPTRKNFVLGLSLTPISAVGYDVSTVREITDGLFTFPYYSQRVADGGLNDFSVSGALRLWKRKISLGASLGYIFGSVKEDAVTQLGGSSNVAQFTSDTRLGGLSASLGVNYTDTLKSSAQNIRFSLLIKLPTALSATERLTAVGTVSSYDTLSERSGTNTIPIEFGFGAGYEFTGRYFIGMEVRYQDWSNYKYFGVSQSLNSRLRVALGAEWIPVYGSNNFLKRVNYRAGLSYENTYLTLRNTAIANYAFTMGVGLPLNRNLSFINLAATVGQRGTRNEDLIRENYFQFVVGLNFNELWFVKRRYD